MNVHKARSRRSPTVTLEDAVALIERINRQVGFSAASREILAQAIGYSSLSGPASSKIAALRYFLLLEKGGSRLRLSALSSRILVPTSDAEGREAIAQAAREPELYADLFQKFAGAPLPQMLANMLVRDFGIIQKKGEEVAENFRQTAGFAGLLRNGILYQELASSLDVPADLQTPEEELNGSNSNAEVSEGLREHLVPLRQGNAHIQLPDPLSAEDLVRVRKWAELMEALIAE